MVARNLVNGRVPTKWDGFSFLRAEGGPEGDVRKTMVARDLVNGRVPTKWEGFSFPDVTLRSSSSITNHPPISSCTRLV